MSYIVLRCKKCRNMLIDSRSTPILSGHEAPVTKETIQRPDSSSDCVEFVNSLYFPEQDLPEWIIKQVSEVDWIKGKLICCSCSSRLGSFDFVSGRKCSCKGFIIPPVHIIKNKVDLLFYDENKT